MTQFSLFFCKNLISIILQRKNYFFNQWIVLSIYFFGMTTFFFTSLFSLVLLLFLAVFIFSWIRRLKETAEESQKDIACFNRSFADGAWSIQATEAKRLTRDYFRFIYPNGFDVIYLRVFLWLQIEKLIRKC